MTTCSKLLLGRTNSPRLHCFLQRTDVVHPRRKSTARWDNMEQRRPVGIYLPKFDVMLDIMLICTGQSQAGDEDQPRTVRWSNVSHITRLPPTTATYFQVQCCYRISLPLIPITRLPPATARYTRTVKYARRLLYFTNYQIHDYGDFTPRNRMPDESKQHTRRIFIGQRSGAYGPGAPMEQN